MFIVSPFNQWHALDRNEQAKYYEMARKEKELHLQLYPGWSARDNYAVHQKKKKRKKEPLPLGMRSDSMPMDMGGVGASGLNVPGIIGGSHGPDAENKPCE